MEHKKKISGKAYEIQIKFIIYLVVHQCYLLVLTNVPQLYKKLTLGQLGEGYMGTLYTTCDFFVSPRLFQNIKLIKKKKPMDLTLPSERFMNQLLKHIKGQVFQTEMLPSTGKKLWIHSYK